MADIQTQLPVKLTDNTNTVAITAQSGIGVQNAVFTVVTGTLATAGDVVTATAIGGSSGAIVTISGTYTGLTFDFSASDDGGTTFYPIAGNKTDESSSNTTFSPANNSSNMWTVYYSSVNRFKVHASAVASGTANVRITPAALATDPDVNVGTITTTPSGTQTVVGSGTFTTAPTGTQTVAYGSGTFPVSGTVTSNAGTGTFTTAPTGTQTVNAATVATTTDKTQSTGLTAAGTVVVSTNGCSTAYLTLTGNGAGMAFTIQGQDGNGNWNNVAALTLAGAIVTAGTTLSANGQWLVPCGGFQAVRANLTAITSGTATFNWEAGSGTQVVGIINTVTTSPTGTQTTAPTGTQTVTGTVTLSSQTVTAVQSGTYTTAPTGTQTVAGTVTSNAGTGTFTTAPTGTQTVNAVTVATTTDKTQSTGLTAAGTVVVSTNGCSTAYLTLTGNGAGMAFTIQGEDSNSNWNNISALTLAGAIVTAGTTLSANGQWIVPCGGFQAVRANLTAITSGTATFSWEAGSGTQAVGIINTVTTSPTGTQTVAYGSGTFPVSGTVTSNAGTGTFTTAPTGTQTVTGTVTAVQSGTFTTAPTGTQTVNAATVATTTDKTQSTGLTAAGTVVVSTNGCSTAYLTLTGNGAGMAFTIQGQDGNGNWNNVAALTLAGAIVTAGTTLSANGQWLVPCGGFQAVRANLTAITSGTATFNWEAGSGTQVVGIINTVTTSPTGTQTTTPTGTQTVIQASTSSITVVPSGTQTVTGTVTSNAGTGTFTTAPTGTQTVNQIQVSAGVVISYSTSASIANGSTGTLSYTVTTGKTLYLKEVIGAASGGPCRVQVDYGAGPTIVCVVFFATTAPYVIIPFNQPVAISSATTVNIKILNNAGSTQDVYGTFIGLEV